MGRCPRPAIGRTLRRRRVVRCCCIEQRFGSGSDNQRLGDDAERVLHGERSVGERHAGGLARSRELQCRTGGSRDACRELDRRPVVLAAAEGTSTGPSPSKDVPMRMKATATSQGTAAVKAASVVATRSSTSRRLARRATSASGAAEAKAAARTQSPPVAARSRCSCTAAVAARRSPPGRIARTIRSSLPAARAAARRARAAAHRLRRRAGRQASEGIAPGGRAQAREPGPEWRVQPTEAGTGLDPEFFGERDSRD